MAKLKERVARLEQQISLLMDHTHNPHSGAVVAEVSTIDWELTAAYKDGVRVGGESNTDNESA